jgi:lipopolysaccharide/colanic/teichoic acid biosynthesis glycosyltransferase
MRLDITDLTLRTLDMIGATLVLLLSSPVIILIAILIKRDSPGPVVFKQARVGENGTRFVFYKFRTMCNGAQEMLPVEIENPGRPVVKVKNDPRITCVGGILRRTLLDELPQLINVLKGEMSLVGPRPVMPVEFERYTQEQKLRLAGKPGMTGLAQISGGTDLPFDKIVELDKYYLEHRSVRLYLEILIKTIPWLISGKGIV